MAEELEHNNPSTRPGTVPKSDDDVEGHAGFPLLDDTDPDQAKLKLANDEDDDDDVEAHKVHGENVP
jgi:hypothetical protein